VWGRGLGDPSTAVRGDIEKKENAKAMKEKGEGFMQEHRMG